MLAILMFVFFSTQLKSKYILCKSLIDKVLKESMLTIYSGNHIIILPNQQYIV